MKHTPGEWIVRSLREDCFVQAPRLNPSHPYDIEVLGDDYGDELYPSEMRRADAHLIAAAPNMLEALKDFVSVCETAPPIELIKMIGDSCEKAKQAIDKAEEKENGT